MSRLDWVRWPVAPASCIADDEADCGAPSAHRSGPGCDAWCVSSRDRCSRPVAWHRPPPEPCHGSAPSADVRALPEVQTHPEPAPGGGGPGAERNSGGSRRIRVAVSSMTGSCALIAEKTKVRDVR